MFPSGPGVLPERVPPLADRARRPPGQEHRDPAPGAAARHAPRQGVHDQDAQVVRRTTTRGTWGVLILFRK